MPYVPDVPAGHHLGNSRTADGAVKGHIFEDGTNELKGHADWHWVDDEPSHVHVHSYYEPLPSPEEIQALRAREAARAAHQEMVNELILQLLEAVTPHVKRWLSEKVVSPVKSKWERVPTARKVKRRGGADGPSPACSATSIASCTGGEITFPTPEVRMTLGEWEERVRAIEAAGVFRDEQRRILAHARIEEDAVAIDASSATEGLTAQEFADRIGLQLRAAPALPDGKAIAPPGTDGGKLARPSVERTS